MSSRLIKLGSAVVLAAPLVLVFGPHPANAYDCDHKYGGAAMHPTCDDPGLPLRVQEGKTYRVTGEPFASNVTIGFCEGASLSSTGEAISGAETADSAESVVQSGGSLVAGLADHAGRNVGYEVVFSGTPTAITITCRDDHAPFTH